jgi:hypothetical protein
MSETSGNGNGEHGVERTPLDTLVLTYDRARDHLEVGGKCNSFDLMLDILARATRTIEAQLRAQRAVELQQQLAQAARDRAIADSIRNGR